MKVLWITNTTFPAVCKELRIPIPVVGGWMYSSASQLLNKYGDIELGVASLYKGKKMKTVKLGDVTYFLLPRSKTYKLYDKKLESVWKHIDNLFCPEIVHIHGTEYTHGLSYLNSCNKANVVVSLQGIVSVIERYYYGGIDQKYIKTTLRDLVKNDSIFKQRSKFKKRGEFEKIVLKNSKHIIGRTTWDKTHAWTINPRAEYHFCNETLRDEFYKHKWKVDECEKYSIFLSQAHYPLKGFHQLIQALPLILREYPETRVYVAGNNFLSAVSILKRKGFWEYIRLLLKKNDVTDKVVFTGLLSEKEMCQRYLKSNVFVCPSSIENSPNSIGESQLLGVPCVASFVGGIPDMIKHEETGLLYRFEEIEMLAKSICRIFSNKNLANTISVNSRQVAKQRHNQKINTQKTYEIYQSICKK